MRARVSQTPFALPPGMELMMADVCGGSETPSMVRKVTIPDLGVALLLCPSHAVHISRRPRPTCLFLG